MFTLIGSVWINLLAVCCFDARLEGGSFVYLQGGHVLKLDDAETKALMSKFGDIDRAQSAASLGIR
jgi:hypothetical protein